MAITINSSVYSTEIISTVNDITINVRIGASISTVSVLNADQRLIFDGVGGDTYLVYNSTNNKLELFVDGTKKISWGN